jgi:predicted RNA-binding protein
MCQLTAYLEQDGQEELLLEDVGLIKAEGDKFWLISIFGERELVDAKIKVVDLLNNKLVLERRA